MTSPTNEHRSPKPIPYIFNDFNNLTTKKEKYSVTPKVRKVPPRPPIKSISKVSRLSCTLNNSQQNQKAQIISFKHENHSQLSKLYDESLPDTYFKQVFNIEERIGSGSFGDVYKVKSRDDGRYYAVKVSRERFRGKADREEKLNEVCKHEQLPRHDHLVKLHLAWEEKNRLYIQTELCSSSLSALAETNHEISEDIVWRYLIDLLKALDHLHSNDLIHLDIKPDNIFISRDNLCKLGDFGLVYDVKNRPLSEATEGDPKYLASEVMQGIYTKAADIFSLGMTILELASDLDLPSRGQSWHMLRNIKNIPDSVFSKMSPDLKSVILLMIAPDYQSRPTARELLNHPIVAKFENLRRRELQWKRCHTIFADIKCMLLSLCSKLASYLNVLALPLRNRFSNLFPALTNQDDSANLNSSPPNYNRTFVTTYLDQYSDDDTNDIRLLSSSSFDSSLSNEDEFRDNLNARNLCSTANRTNKKPMVSHLSPFFSSDNSVDNNAISMDSIKSVTQKLTFDDFSSDEMELTENEEDELRSSAIVAAKSQQENASRLRFRQNITRKNLAKTFDEINYEFADT